MLTSPDEWDDEDELPWDSAQDLLGSVVYRLEQEWNNHYQEIRDAFGPVIDGIFRKLKEKQ